jgi:hypothetical protein
MPLTSSDVTPVEAFYASQSLAFCIEMIAFGGAKYGSTCLFYIIGESYKRICWQPAVRNGRLNTYKGYHTFAYILAVIYQTNSYGIYRNWRHSCLTFRGTSLVCCGGFVDGLEWAVS